VSERIAAISADQQATRWWMAGVRQCITARQHWSQRWLAVTRPL